jgi:hypothetical protein
LHTTHQYDGVLHGFCKVSNQNFSGCQLIPPVANWFHRLPTDATGCQPAKLLPTVKLHGWHQLAAGGIGWQPPVESVGNRWNQLAMVKNCMSTKFSWY